MRSYRQNQEQNSPQKQIQKIPFSTIYSNDRFKYVIMPGNNSRLIKEAMQRRDWWIETPPFNSMFNFKWKPFSQGIRFENVTSQNHKQIVNHFEYHAHLSEKSLLFKNLQQHAEATKENVFNFAPISYFIEVDLSKPNAYNTALAPFLTFF